MAVGLQIPLVNGLLCDNISNIIFNNFRQLLLVNCRRTLRIDTITIEGYKNWVSGLI